MGNELIFSRIYGLSYGNSIDSWIKMLIFSIISLSLGYYLGGKIKRHRFYLLLIFGIAILYQIFLIEGSFYIFEKIATKSSDFFKITFIIYSIGIMAFLMGLVTPLLVNYLCNKTEVSRSFLAGMIYGSSTLGGVIITLLFGFMILPNQGLIVANNVLIAFLVLSFLLVFLNKIIVVR